MEGAALLGRGKLSVVHRTRRRADGQLVVLKKIEVFEMGSKERSECMNEIELLRQMQHPHIISYLDCVLEDNELTLVMEAAEQGDLAGLIKRTADSGATSLGEPLAWRYVMQIADALAYMHERRVMHRDVKPANVFVTAPHTMKLGDLGLGRYFSSKTEQTHSNVGTPFYMSPECMQGRGYDFRSDIWSLGCLFYELAMLRSPFFQQGINFYMLGRRIMSRQFDPLPPNFSPEMGRLVDAMLQVDPSHRPPASAILEAARGEATKHGSAG